MISPPPGAFQDPDALLGILRKARAIVADWQHGEGCPREGHNHCGEFREKGELVWYCEDGEEKEECLALDCECGIDELVALLGGDASCAEAFSAVRLAATLEERDACAALCEEAGQAELAQRILTRG